MLKDLFDLRGRTSLLRYWRTWLVLFAFWAAVWLASLLAATILNMRVSLALAAIGAVPIFIAEIALFVRRLHDRGKSAWWLLWYFGFPAAMFELSKLAPGGEKGLAGAILGLVGIVVGLWGMVEMCLLRGTPVPNRFGPVPT